MVIAAGGATLWLSRGEEPGAPEQAEGGEPGAPATRVNASAARAAFPTAPPGKSPEQERLEQRRWLYEMVDSLLVNREIERARKYLDEGLARYGEDAAPEWRDLDAGYRLIADCLEQPDVTKHKVRASAFIGVTEAPSLIPKIRAACR